MTDYIHNSWTCLPWWVGIGSLVFLSMLSVSFEVYIMEMGDSMCLSWCHCVIIRIDNKQLETPRCNLLCDSHSLTSSCGWPKWRGITVGTIFFFHAFSRPLSGSLICSLTHSVSLYLSLTWKWQKENEAAGLPTCHSALNWHLLTSRGVTVPLSKKLGFFYSLACHFIATAYAREAAMCIESF